MKSSTTSYIPAIIVAVALIGGFIYWKNSVWNECRLTHSKMYCLSMISR